MGGQLLLHKTFEVLDNAGVVPKGVEDHIKGNLNKKFQLRPYQRQVLEWFCYYMDGFNQKVTPTALLFHMATGSGKTLIMAGIILHLYEKGYRNFIFFVHSKAIIEKTRDNFLNSRSSKYLFDETIAFSGGRRVNVTEVENFDAANPEGINIVFTTIQGLHRRLSIPRENSLTYEDFENKKVVLLSDEAHHINAETKRGQRAIRAEDTWENTVTKIFESHPDNYLLEFTATADLSHPEIKAKYCNRILFDYPLRDFRTDGYSKEVKVLQSDHQPYERALQAVILSQYRQKVFEKHHLRIKPVILFKSKNIRESGDFYDIFVSRVSNLTVAQLREIRVGDSDAIISKAFRYFESNGITLENLVLEIKNDFIAERCIQIDSKKDSEERQLAVNSLEDADNKYRAVFAVNKLNEGWDVLNLFDIVRLYNTQSTGGANKGKVGKTTISEAQLIGRGARYCPFKVSDDQKLYERKYDSDTGNDLRICEELYYHSADNPRYISELNKALVEVGIKDPHATTRTLILKEEFKATELYKKGVIYVNEPKPFSGEHHHELDEVIREAVYEKKFITGKVSVGSLMDGDIEQSSTSDKVYCLTSFSLPIVHKALNKVTFYRFDNLLRFFPQLKSMSEFINGENFLKPVKIRLIGTHDQVTSPTNEMRLQASIMALEQISKRVEQHAGCKRGGKQFIPLSISQVWGQDGREKTITLSVNRDHDRELGTGQADTDDPDLYLDLSKEHWYVFEENYGTSEEKYLVKYIKSVYQSLKQKYKDVYLIRNERHFTIYSFDEGKRFAPDFVLFLVEKDASKPKVYQIFIEPKGTHLLTNEDSQVKNRFLCQLEEECELDVVSEDEEFRVVGLPLYNREKTEQQEFQAKLKELCGQELGDQS